MTFLDINNLPSGYTVVSEINNSFYLGEITYLIQSDEDLVFLRKDPYDPSGFRSEDEPGYSVSQFIMPVSAVSWAYNVVTSIFWKLPNDGGASPDMLHYKKNINGETIKLRFTPNCRREFEPGITISNLSRPGKIKKSTSIQIPYHLLREKGLVDQFKKISDKYEFNDNR
ncbi:hypothetical protein [Agaribacterium sp. ZY112]|uniref:hypothetical protein n=1 Tax=Agaribacterium sp. ZY112 TaxID=3233574 RepID=UPI003526467F